VVLIVALLTFFWAFSIFRFLSTKDHIHIGQIMALTQTSITIDDKKDGIVMIQYSSGTRIFAEKKQDPTLQIGKHVFIPTITEKNGTLKAKFIRITYPHKKK